MTILGLILVSPEVAQTEAQTETTVITSTSTELSNIILISPTTATVYVSEGFTLNLRNGPGTEYTNKAALAQNQEVIIEGKDADCTWVYVTTPPSQFGGWVRSLYLKNSQGNLVIDKCPASIETSQPNQDLPTPISDERDSPLDTSGESENSRGRQSIPEQTLIVALLSLLATAAFCWLAYTRDFFSRVKRTPAQTMDSIPKVGTPYLEYVSASAQPRYYALNSNEISIGRDLGNTLVIDEHFGRSKAEGVSLQHARIERDGDTFVIVDLDSKNGVFVDDRRTQENMLYNGMQVRLGEVEFVFRLNRG